ncbi:serine/threonine-protein kinase [Actinomadura sp. WMMB 499]|uniref:protein kinase domain-containing protein n=1 Tax=Actinomadura sp. WMMB 499 TaxID=1219491 RepID=UPI00124619EA|nr:serine/threonine-protein kinase [Actinomadura sp. WMMB 499]QFG24861.1 serine/threonine protein kinase [Actinomadura sp. WMMB 499]
MGEVDGTDEAAGTRRDAGATRRDGPRVPGPRGAAETRRDGQGTDGASLMRLPADLAGRYEAVAELPVQGAESDLLLVRDAHGAEHVAKIFRRGYRADRDVWAKLPELDSPHVLRILETGHADGRDYEVTAYAPDGNLRALMDGPLPPDAVADVAAQLADGLAALHRAGIVHRDLKPENVLVLGTAPLRLVIADFGLSKVLEQSVVFASSSRTLAYAAPESLSGQVSPARDWWSLGMIVRELATGRAPFRGLSETVVVDHLATRPVGADDVADPRLRLLCRGLLARDPRRRWTGAEVAAWLAGGSPPVAEEPDRPVEARGAEPGPGAGLPFKGRRYARRDELARALVAEWEHAAQYFFGRGESGEAWRSLRAWLAEVPDDSSIELVDGRLTADLAPDVKLLHLVRWLDPELPPHFLGRRVTADDLALLPAHVENRGADHRVACELVRELWRHGLLKELAGFAGGAELAGVDGQWRAHAAAWNELAGWIRAQDAPPPALAARLPDAGADDPPLVPATLLALAADPARTHRKLAEGVVRARAAVAEPVPWFEWLADGAGDDPLRLLAVMLAAPEAAVEVESRKRARRAERERSAAQRAQRDERERARLAGRGAAVRRAVLWTLPLLPVWLFGSWIVGELFAGDPDGGPVGAGSIQRSSGVPFGFLAVLSVVVWAAQCGVEVLLARAQGADYLPQGPWAMFSKVLGAGGRGLSTASRTVSGAAQRTGRRGCGLVLLAATIPLLLVFLLLAAVTPVAGLLWTLVLIAAPVAHGIVAGVRLNRWREVRRGTATGGA